MHCWKLENYIPSQSKQMPSQSLQKSFIIVFFDQGLFFSCIIFLTSIRWCYSFLFTSNNPFGCWWLFHFLWLANYEVTHYQHQLLWSVSNKCSNFNAHIGCLSQPSYATKVTFCCKSMYRCSRLSKLHFWCANNPTVQIMLFGCNKT